MACETRRMAVQRLVRAAARVYGDSLSERVPGTLAAIGAVRRVLYEQRLVVAQLPLLIAAAQATPPTVNLRSRAVQCFCASVDTATNGCMIEGADIAFESR